MHEMSGMGWCVAVACLPKQLDDDFCDSCAIKGGHHQHLLTPHDSIHCEYSFTPAFAWPAVCFLWLKALPQR